MLLTEILARANRPSRARHYSTSHTGAQNQFELAPTSLQVRHEAREPTPEALRDGRLDAIVD